jgi:hypothetical protein
MANITGKLYIRSKVGYRKPPKRLANLPVGEIYQLFWYCGTKKKSKAVSRFADEAQTALIKKEAELRTVAVTGILTNSGRDEASFVCTT